MLSVANPVIITLVLVPISFVFSIGMSVWVFRTSRHQPFMQHIVAALLLKCVCDVVCFGLACRSDAISQDSNAVNIFTPFTTSINIIIPINVLMISLINSEILAVFSILDERLTPALIYTLRCLMVVVFGVVFVVRTWCVAEFADQCQRPWPTISYYALFVYSSLVIVLDHAQCFFLAFKVMKLTGRKAAAVNTARVSQSLKKVVMTNLAICAMDYTVGIAALIWGMNQNFFFAIGVVVVGLTGIHLTVLVVVLRNLRHHIQLGIVKKSTVVKATPGSESIPDKTQLIQYHDNIKLL
ncbi:hypothetical protein HDV03_003505 [Kappamyces sp. JEL0829]|nr:hypothetical protein HDV03_003505 [Kappamyces sp. JEL0829]